ncbi:MAG: nicotinamide riboside transporter PnuC [Prevotellaceae bacterium]|jgi:nicotinamide mononucleotide transporter|nr:nicotinamide riboside transporter PnuC [Prevotellaceae bacterium]
MIEWIIANRIEIVGAILAFVYIILEIKQKWTFWIASIISSSFYVYIFFDTKLYAEMGLNMYFIVMAAYGLYCWKLSPNRNAAHRDFHFISQKTALRLAAIAFIVSGFLFFILSNYTDSPVPAPDAIIAALSILATWMVAKKIVECWYVWIITDVFATGLYLHQNLYPTAVLFAAYSILSVVGLIEWRKLVISD